MKHFGRPICLVVLFVAVAVGQSDPRRLPTQAEKLAAESLRRSAVALVNTSNQLPSRAARLVAITDFAEQLDPHNPRTLRLLADIYEIQQKADQAAEALQRCMAGDFHDHVLAMRWLDLKREGLQDAPRRIAFYQSILQGQDYPPALRAEAAVEWAKILHRQGDKAGQRQAFQQALQEDPYHPAALVGLLGMQEDPDPLSRAEALLGQLHSNPMAVGVAWELAQLLNSVGLFEASVEMFEYAWTIFQKRNAPQEASAMFLTQYFDALLDVDRPQKAIDLLAPLPEKITDQTYLNALRIEALQAAGQIEQADQLADAMEAAYKSKFLATKPNPAEAAELAWFYLITRPRPSTALLYARIAAEKISSPSVQRIVGVAEISSGQLSQGMEKLKAVADQDLYAAAFLAEKVLSQGESSAGQQAIEAAASQWRGGPAFRKLRAVARQHGLEIPAAKDSQKLRPLLDSFDRRVLAMARAPQKIIAVRLEPLRDQPAVGEPIELRATLTNQGPLAVPLGDWGLLSPVMAWIVTVEGDPETVFEELPLAVWPAPRYLQPGQSVSTTVRLDVGAMAEALDARCLETVKLNVSGIVDPIQRGQETRSALPDLVVTPVEITRRSLLGQRVPDNVSEANQAYQLALGGIVRDLRRGDLTRRMAAARKVAALLHLSHALSSKRVFLPKPLDDGLVRRPVLLSLLRAFLADASPVVRAEMVTSLAGLPLDSITSQLLAPIIEDPEAMVRFRLAELMGTTDPQAHRAVLERLAEEDHQAVRMMARSLLPQDGSWEFGH